MLQAVVANGLVFVSGLLPITPSGEKLVNKPFAEQATAVFLNLREILTAAGTDTDHLVSVRVYITDIANWAEFNRLYALFCGEHRPARAVVPVPVLHFGLLLELEATACARDVLRI